MDIRQFTTPCAREVLCQGSQNGTDRRILKVNGDAVVSVAA